MYSPMPFPPLQQKVLLGKRGGIAYWHGAIKLQEGTLREVLIKEMLSGDQEVRRRFWQEGEVTTRLRHIGVTRLVARSEQRLAFDWIPGESLRLLLNRQHTMPLAEGVNLLRELLGALEYLHSEGVVHHDIKPENVMLPVGWPQVAQPVILVDFGMAYDHLKAQDIHAGTRMGTPQFMPPEQFRGVRGDARSDLYSAGALLFDALVGHPPFPNALGWLAGFDSTQFSVPGPLPLSQLISTALRREPADRIQTAAKMMDMLLRIPV